MGRVTSGQSAMSEVLPLRDTDPRQVGVYRLLGRLGEEAGRALCSWLWILLEAGRRSKASAADHGPAGPEPLSEGVSPQRSEVARFCTAQVLDAGIFERRPFIVE